MPMIEAKVTMQLPAEKRDVLKAEFGKAISIIGKPESYLMINLIDNQDLYFLYILLGNVQLGLERRKFLDKNKE